MATSVGKSNPAWVAGIPSPAADPPPAMVETVPSGKTRRIRPFPKSVTYRLPSGSGATAAIQVHIRRRASDRSAADRASVFRGYPPALLAVVRTAVTEVPAGDAMLLSTYENAG